MEKPSYIKVIGEAALKAIVFLVAIVLWLAAWALAFIVDNLNSDWGIVCAVIALFLTLTEIFFLRLWYQYGHR